MWCRNSCLSSPVSRTTSDGKFPLADGLSRVAQRFANVLDLKVRISIQYFDFRHAFAYHTDNGSDRYTQARGITHGGENATPHLGQQVG